MSPGAKHDEDTDLDVELENRSARLTPGRALKFEIFSKDVIRQSGLYGSDVGGKPT